MFFLNFNYVYIINYFPEKVNKKIKKNALFYVIKNNGLTTLKS